MQRAGVLLRTFRLVTLWVSQVLPCHSPYRRGSMCPWALGYQSLSCRPHRS